MATRRILLLFLMSFLSTSPAAAVKSWCSQTPHPKPCEYFLTNNPKYKVSIKGKPDFVRAAAHLALDRCMHAKSGLHHLGPNCRSDREREAWADCVDLYEETIHVLNKTVDPNTKCTADDVQTWLSTALTNLDTCAAGFADFGIHDYHSVFPIMSNNVSLLVSNALALNSKGVSNFNSVKGYKDGFPRWVRPGHRKLLQSSSDVVVAQDGSGNFTTVGEAVAAAAAGGSRPVGSDWYVIYVKAGTYVENVEIGRGLRNVMLLGDGIGRTIITGSRSVDGGSTTFNSATVVVVGDGFIARGITFRNTAGAQSQAVALRSGSNLSVFYQCSFEGYQATLYAHSQRQFYRDCDIYGTVDMVIGNAAVVLQNCSFHARIPAEMINTITSQFRTDPNQNTGTIIHNSRVMPTPELVPLLILTRTYLGRPAREFSRTVFMKTELGGLIHPAGWLEWMGTTFALDTLYYAEYANTGPGSSTENRVKWPGYHVITNTSEAEQFAPDNFILVDHWVPNTNVPFTSGL
ncbi:probable pectinesterase/pectinesterase inhibitor 17 [Salvia hispanica]|uniref:probable pectinesterase/pectinesterase inhibitor 17 n=1 Tax=Salvia hispanica TaxID=49212 RepID=UPI002009490A|nr:probable pectinesterase/pectinesterase inhibitor 17 [Salvia hispanica]